MPQGIKDKVAILGMGCSKFGERWDKEADDLIVEAFEECVADAGIETCTSSIAVANQAASIWLRSMPASATHSSNASTIRSSASLSQRSPNLEHPMPRIATLSLIPCGIVTSFVATDDTWPGRPQAPPGAMCRAMNSGVRPAYGPARPSKNT